jgi:hypothetical protein
VNRNREEILVSPIALAANVGDFPMLDSLLNYLQNIKIDEGVQTRALDPPIHKNRGHK